MYSLQDVLDALRDQPLSSALEKIVAFATATGYSDLAHWASTELNGYEDHEVPSYRGVNIFWANSQGRAIDLSFSEEVYTAFSYVEISRGVFELEPRVGQTMIFPHPSAAQALKNIFMKRTGGSSPVILGVALTPETLETLFRRIRMQARQRVQQAIPTANAAITVRPLPDLTWMTDPHLKSILEERWKEADAAQKAGAPLATIILLGSILEGALLYKAERNPAQANTAGSAPKESDGNGVVRVKRFQFWTLDNLLVVAHEVGWLGREVKDFSVVLRSYRNFVHPGEQKRQGIKPSSSICDVCWPVVTAALSDLARP